MTKGKICWSDVWGATRSGMRRAWLQDGATSYVNILRVIPVPPAAPNLLQLPTCGTWIVAVSKHPARGVHFIRGCIRVKSHAYLVEKSTQTPIVVRSSKMGGGKVLKRQLASSVTKSSCLSSPLLRQSAALRPLRCMRCYLMWRKT